MSLQYIIDGYNIIHHTTFTQSIPKKSKDSRIALLEFIKLKKLTGSPRNKLTGSPRNKITVVFDGYPDSKGGIEHYPEDFAVIFSRNQSADERIRKELKNCHNPKEAVVVSDDREIKFFARYSGAKIIGVEEFISPRKNAAELHKRKELVKPELSYSEIHRINEELKKIWLK